MWRLTGVLLIAIGLTIVVARHRLGDLYRKYGSGSRAQVALGEELIVTIMGVGWLVIGVAWIAWG